MKATAYCVLGGDCLLCGDYALPEGFTVGSLAETLSLSTVWYFWWD